MNRTLALSLSTLALLGLAASGAHAQILVQYAAPNTAVVNPPQAATTTASGTTASSLDVGSFFGPGAGLGENGNGAGVFAIAANNPGANPDFNTALSSGAYITFTVSPTDSNTVLDLSSITLPIYNQGGNTDRTFSLLSSVGGFDSGHVLTSVNDGTLNYTFGSEFQNLAAPVEFRLVISGPQQYRTMGLRTRNHFDYGTGEFVYDSAPTLNGTVTAAPIAEAPEPSQFAAFGVGLLGLGVLSLKAKRRVSAC